ncbi:uncharacterized protein HKW66_Vig0091270 [Vigna angularis]|uniref:DUF7731 domain-containing protein n=1 Tax=Phaseolus angularis TaxID=3914 RepID=A0A8T0KHF3_PHAAN|nr:uncharacterized protein HKW66_Vig0091270 [Vigna angularis]
MLMRTGRRERMVARSVVDSAVLVVGSVVVEAGSVVVEAGSVLVEAGSELVLVVVGSELVVVVSLEPVVVVVSLEPVVVGLEILLNFFQKPCNVSMIDILNEKGNLNVPKEKTDMFCQGPCLSETNLVLNCLNNVFSNFIFYNKATIHDIRNTIEAACSYGSQRGNFNVAEHIQNDENKASPKATTSHAVMGLAVIVMGRALLPPNFT